MTAHYGLSFPRSVPRYRTTPALPTPDAVRRAAALTVADRSTGPQDCAELLEALGLLPHP